MSFAFVFVCFCILCHLHLYIYIYMSVFCILMSFAFALEMLEAWHMTSAAAPLLPVFPIILIVRPPNCQATKNCTNCHPTKIVSTNHNLTTLFFWHEMQTFQPPLFIAYDEQGHHVKSLFCETWTRNLKIFQPLACAEKVPFRPPWMYIVYKVNILWFSLTESGRKCVGTAIDIHLRRHGRDC